MSSARLASVPDQRISSVRVSLSYLAPSYVFRTNEFRTPELQVGNEAICTLPRI